MFLQYFKTIHVPRNQNVEIFLQQLLAHLVQHYTFVGSSAGGVQIELTQDSYIIDILVIVIYRLLIHPQGSVIPSLVLKILSKNLLLS